MSINTNTFRDKAVGFVKEAVAADNEGDYQKALDNYKIALEYFNTYLKYEKNPRSRDAVIQKMRDYLSRAEYMKECLGGQVQEAPAAANGTTGQKAKPPGGEDDKEDKDKEKLRSSLGQAIMMERPNVKWDDVAGLEGAKDSLKEAVILPVKFPQFFTGKRKPWSGILLYGPPGTGKSYLAKAVATEAASTFFNISSSDLVSKWLGESEKLVSQLFSLARERSPSIVFIDEIDALCSARGEGESEAARRIKTEFLVQMQGVGSSQARVLVLGATNLPYALDQAVRRRFDRRVYIPLPEEAARAHMFRVHLGDTPHSLSKGNFEDLARRTEGFSGSDIAVVVKDVLMQPVRLVQEATHFRQVRHPDGKVQFEPCAPAAQGATPITLTQLADQGDADKVAPPMITMRDFEKVLLRARPTVSHKDLKVFEDFTKEFGEEG